MKQALTKKEYSIWYFDGNGQKIEGVPLSITGYVTDITGDVSGITGNVSGIRGDIDDCKITNKERIKGIKIEELIKS